MEKKIYGQGHSRIIPDALLAEKISMQVYSKNIEQTLTPNIAKAEADFEGDLVCGKVVKFMREDDTVDPSIFQDVQENEEPEVDVIELCDDEVEICGEKKLHIKLSVNQLKSLECEGLDSIYFNKVTKTIDNTLDRMWDESHIATMITQAAAENTGNNAFDGIANLGSPDNPIIIPADRTAAADALEAVYSDLQLVLQKQNAMSMNGDTALILPTLAANRSLRIFRDMNICCGENNIRIKGQLPQTIYGFDSFQTNRQVLSTIHNGRRIYYIIAADKHASGFVSEIYNYKWWEGKFDWYLVGNETHGSYVVQPTHVAIAVVSFA